MKTCSKCKFKQPSKNFDRWSSTKDGFHPQCKICRREYQSAWYFKNRQRLLAKMKKWHKDNPEKHKIINDRWLAKRKHEAN